ncbi:Unknown protein, partial [Striga hermonthica]
SRDLRLTNVMRRDLFRALVKRTAGQKTTGKKSTEVGSSATSAAIPESRESPQEVAPTEVLPVVDAAAINQAEPEPNVLGTELVMSELTHFEVPRDEPEKHSSPLKSVESNQPEKRKKRKLVKMSDAGASSRVEKRSKKKHDSGQVVTQFRGYNPEKFSGQGDPCLVEEWIQGLETIFEITECTERQRIICAQLQMTGDAWLWWNSYWGMRPGEKENLTWMQFKEMMEEKYYPAHYRTEMERQFLALSQGNRTVDEYEREFTRLGSFVKYLVDTEAKKARRFQDGLQREIRHHVAGHCIQTYADIVAKAQEVDASFRRGDGQIQ